MISYDDEVEFCTCPMCETEEYKHPDRKQTTMALINPYTTPAVPVKIKINVGACIDIATGTFLKGVRGEHILNGGLPTFMGIIGGGNSFKSTLMHYTSLTALSRMPKQSSLETYDCETNIEEWHLKTFADRIPEFAGEDLINGTGRWKIVDKRDTSGTEWYNAQKKFLAEKRKEKSWLVKTPFVQRDGVTPLEIITPTFGQIDTLTEFTSDDVDDINDKAELGDKDANIIHMRQGLSKLRILSDAPHLNGGSYNFMTMVAQLGREHQMQNTGPGGMQPVKSTQHLKGGFKIKGVTEKFLFTPLVCWWCEEGKVLLNAGTKGPEYPRDTNDDLSLDTDLNVVRIKTTRGKSGKSGLPINLVVSQSEGVLASLTEFHHIKEMGRYGLEGNNTTYALNLLPDVKLMRTTVRGKIDKDPILRRALNITSEMCQIDYLWHHAKPVMCTPKELYDDLKAMGYDWSVLLNTRGWWTTLENEAGFPPFLSTWDLLLMRVGEYVPFWFTEEQKAAIDLSKAKKRTGF